jgi:hypothetical protein
MKENVIISLVDANYFELLNELIDTIKRFNEIKKVKWDIEVSSYKVKDKKRLKSQVSRAFYQNIFLDLKKI